MATLGVRAPGYRELRPMRKSEEVTSATFPVYRDLAERLLAAGPGADERVAHVLGTCAGYAYSDAETVAMIMARMGLEENRCLPIAMSVDAMFIRSTAFVVQSRCGRVVLVCYRGTEPARFINWLTDADVNPERVSFPFPGESAPLSVHAGFYRNVRATRYRVAGAVAEALAGRSVLGDGEATGRLEALYFTGHSLGAAMAALLAVMVETEPAYQPIRERLRAVYTFGQPMIGDPALARACAAHPFLGRSVFRYIYAHDVVPALPPTASGPFAHFGREFQYRPGKGGGGTWNENATPVGQVSNLLDLPVAALAFMAQQIRWLRRIPFPHSLDDHEPQHYIAALTPPGVRSEFGD